MKRALCSSGSMQHERFATGIADQAAGRDITQLEARRDRSLVELLAMKAKGEGG